jgi:hypothetical protein
MPGCNMCYIICVQTPEVYNMCGCSRCDP